MNVPQLESALESWQRHYDEECRRVLAYFLDNKYDEKLLSRQVLMGEIR
jgi:hypothetical protein